MLICENIVQLDQLLGLQLSQRPLWSRQAHRCAARCHLLACIATTMQTRSPCA
jgi:hypothetical protein